MTALSPAESLRKWLLSESAIRAELAKGAP